jgi:phosphatidylglycerophosphate synthase
VWCLAGEECCSGHNACALLGQRLLCDAYNSLVASLVIMTGLDMFCTVLSIMVSLLLLLLLLFFLLYLLLLLLLSQLLACLTDFPRGLMAGKVKAASRDGHIRILS